MVWLCMVAGPSWATERKQKRPPTIIRTWTLPHPLAQADTTTVDTAYINFPMRNSITDYSLCNTWNGNIVSPLQSAVYFSRTRKTDLMFANQYDAYTITPQDVRFYNTTTPYSMISYQKGFATYKEDNDLRFLCTGNINPRLNLGAGIIYLNGSGHYANQAGKTVNGQVFGSYNGNHYSLQAAFVFNTLSNFENGGIANEADLSGPLGSQDLATRLLGMSGMRSLAGYLNHYYSITVQREQKVHYRERDELGQWQEKDSVKIVHVPVTTFRHVFETGEQTRRYVEHDPQTDYYPTSYRNPYATNDSAAALTIRNTLSVTFEEEFNTKLKFGAIVYAYNECQRYLNAIGQNSSIITLTDKVYNYETDSLSDMSIHLMPDSLYDYTWTNNTFVGGELYKNRGRYIHYGFGGDVCVLGYKIGEFNLNAHLDAGFRLGRDSMTLRAEASFRNETPDYYLTRYLSNHFRWNNDFRSTMKLHIGGQVAYPTRWITAKLKVDYENLTRYIYFNTQGLPQQTDENISVLAGDLVLNLNTPWFNIDNSAVLQYTSSSLLPLPLLALYTNIYYHGVWFKALDAQVGADVHYNTAYYAPILEPALGQFRLQDERRVGNYPVISVYANFYVRSIRLNFFAHYQHLNSSFMNHEYYTMPHYPLNPGTFRAGIAWRFYN